MSKVLSTYERKMKNKKFRKAYKKYYKKLLYSEYVFLLILFFFVAFISSKCFAGTSDILIQDDNQYRESQQENIYNSTVTCFEKTSGHIRQNKDGSLDLYYNSVPHCHSGKELVYPKGE